MPEEIHLGQKIVKYKCPINIVKKINEIYDNTFDSLINNNNNLAAVNILNYIEKQISS